MDPLLCQPFLTAGQHEHPSTMGSCKGKFVVLLSLRIWERARYEASVIDTQVASRQLGQSSTPVYSSVLPLFITYEPDPWPPPQFTDKRLNSLRQRLHGIQRKETPAGYLRPGTPTLPAARRPAIAFPLLACPRSLHPRDITFPATRPAASSLTYQCTCCFAFCSNAYACQLLWLTAPSPSVLTIL